MKNRKGRLSKRALEGLELQEHTDLSRQETLAKRVQQRRANEAIADIKHTGSGCTASTVRCPEARIMLLDTPECCKAHIRRISKDVAALLDREGIRWWIDYGTLLGYVRREWLRERPGDPSERILWETMRSEMGPNFRGLIPYDKDGDWAVYGEDREKLLKLQPELLGMGYHVTFAPPRPTQRFRTGDRMKVRVSQKNLTNVDLFIWYPDKPKKGWLDRKNYIGADLHKGREFPKDWAFPLRRGTWEGIDVSVPARPERLAAHRYGATWQEPRREKHPREVR